MTGSIAVNVGEGNVTSLATEVLEILCDKGMVRLASACCSRNKPRPEQVVITPQSYCSGFSRRLVGHAINVDLRTCQLVSLEIPETKILIPGGLRARTGALPQHEHMVEAVPVAMRKVPMSVFVRLTTRSRFLGEFNNDAAKRIWLRRNQLRRERLTSGP